MSSDSGSSPDVIGKVFLAVGREVRQCLVCGGLFTGRAAADHAVVDCYPFLELSVVYTSTRGNSADPGRLILRKK